MTLWLLLPPPIFSPVKETAPQARSNASLHLTQLLHVMLIKSEYLHGVLTPRLTKARRSASQPWTKGLSGVTVRSLAAFRGGHPLPPQLLIITSPSHEPNHDLKPKKKLLCLKPPTVSAPASADHRKSAWICKQAHLLRRAGTAGVLLL